MTAKENATLYERVRTWIDDDPDPQTAREAEVLLAQAEFAKLSDQFYGHLEFGTAGLRGVLGAGPNRMNRAVVRKTTAGLCHYLIAEIPDARAKGLVIGRDGRRGSLEFGEDAAQVATALGFVVHWFEDYAPTPLTAFAVEHLGAAAGVMVTASHNPPEYNGYKVYWRNAAQIIPPHDTGIAAAIAAVTEVKAIKLLDWQASLQQGLIKVVPPSVQDAYFAALQGLDFHLEMDRDLVIAYTPLHGVGGVSIQRVFAEAGFANLHVVASQFTPDGEFPTVRFPNPEEPGAMDHVLALAAEVSADLVLANDPDADRLAVAFGQASGSVRMLSGNEIGVLLGHHRIVDDPKPTSPRLLVTTIVSSPQLGEIARDLDVEYAETLTGFKWIANQSLAWQARTGGQFAFGYEEALGSSTGPVVRDKDGIGAAIVCARLAAFLKRKGQTLGDRLDDIARQHGVWVSAQHNATYPGSSGAAKIASLMQGLRANLPWQIGSQGVQAIADFQVGTRTSRDGEVAALTDMPQSNVLSFQLQGGNRIVARPSGTEPKIKFYFDVKALPGTDESLTDARARAQATLDELRAAFLALADRISA